jgi:hypothetical protein
MPYLDDLLSPFFPPKDTAKPARRIDGCFEASSGDNETIVGQDMATGESVFRGLPGSSGATVQTPAPQDRPQNDRGVA